MPLHKMNELCEAGEGHQDPRDNEDLLEDLMLWGEEEPILSSSSSSSDSPSPPFVLFSDDEGGGAVTPSPPHSHQSSPPPPAALEAIPWSQSEDEFSSSQGEGPSAAMENPEDAESALQEAIRLKILSLVKFLFLKYRAKQSPTKAEMLSSVIQEHEDDFTVICNEASLFMRSVFGIDVYEVDPSEHLYILVNYVDLTYDEVTRDWYVVPQANYLVMVLATIIIEGDIAPEEKVWETLNTMGLYDGVVHPIFGDPRDLITNVWVQEQYLEYRQVAGSDPACYEFLWGPRAHAEITMGGPLECLLRFISKNPSPIASQS